jgi:hypothetical protein
VEARYGNSWIEGEVVSVGPGSFIKVRIQPPGVPGARQIEPAIPRRLVRRPATGAPAAAAESVQPAKAVGPTTGGAVTTWTDSTGQFKLEASFVELIDGAVVLRRADGTTSRIPFDKLSPEDQRRAAEAAQGKMP